jgi:hypothetical protein
MTPFPQNTLYGRAFAFWLAFTELPGEHLTATGLAIGVVLSALFGWTDPAFAVGVVVGWAMMIVSIGAENDMERMETYLYDPSGGGMDDDSDE